jgi:hypothetical protein
MKTELAFKVNEQGNIPKEAIGVIKDFFNSRKGKNVKMTLQDKRELKSHEQLGYWFAVVVPLFSQHTGYEEEEIHTILKYRAKYVEETEIDGKPVIVVKSLADATKMDMMAIVDETKKWAEFLNLNIPEPDINWRD